MCVPQSGVTPYRVGGGNGGMGCHTLAESGTSLLEYRYLSQITQDPSYAERVGKFFPLLAKTKSIDGLYTNCFQSGTGMVTFGADGDSAYEYMLKAWLQVLVRPPPARLCWSGDMLAAAASLLVPAVVPTLLQGGRKETLLWDMYNAAVDGMEKHLVHKGQDGLTYLSNGHWSGQTFRLEHSMEHLTCFVPGWLALGVRQPRQEGRHLLCTCLYTQNSPRQVHFQSLD